MRPRRMSLRRLRLAVAVACAAVAATCWWHGVLVVSWSPVVGVGLTFDGGGPCNLAASWQYGDLCLQYRGVGRPSYDVMIYCPLK